MNIQINGDYRQDAVAQAVDVEALARAVLAHEHLPEETEVSITFVDDDEMHRLNKEYRGIDRPTDVLSFECDGMPEPDDLPLPEGEVWALGDVIIAPDVAERQTADYGTSFTDELSLLLVHGLLHLCGYDHIEDDEAEEMEGLERQILSAFYGRPFQR